MKALKIAAVASLAMLAACEGSADENLASAAEEAVEAAGNVVSEGAEAVENGARGIDNEVDIDVNLGGDNDGADDGASNAGVALNTASN